MTRELPIEQGWRRGVKEQGGKLLKLTPPENGYPDRLCDMPATPLFLIEFKAPGKEPEAHQTRRHNELRANGKAVFVVDYPFHPHHLREMCTVARLAHVDEQPAAYYA